MPAEVRIEIFADRVGRLVNSETGPVSRANFRAAQAVKETARRKVGKKYSRNTGPRKLANSGRVIPAEGSSWRVAFINPHAFVHHEGHKVAVIRAKNAKFLVFPSAENPQLFVWVKAVKGFKGNPFLRDAARQHGLSVSKSGRLRTNQSILAALRGPTLKKFL